MPAAVKLNRRRYWDRAGCMCTQSKTSLFMFGNITWAWSCFCPVPLFCHAFNIQQVCETNNVFSWSTWIRNKSQIGNTSWADSLKSAFIHNAAVPASFPEMLLQAEQRSWQCWFPWILIPASFSRHHAGNVPKHLGTDWMCERGLNYVEPLFVLAAKDKVFLFLQCCSHTPCWGHTQHFQNLILQFH